MSMDKRLAHISSLSGPDLDRAWQEAFGEAAPALSPSLTRRVLAHALQEQVHGALPVATRRALETLANKGFAALPEPPVRLKPGTRLLREWNGRMHSVLVTDEGFQFDGKTYGSLSTIAERITGAHWSGPRFFGIRRRTPPPVQSRHEQA
jgi:hypothetical protein